MKGARNRKPRLALPTRPAGSDGMVVSFDSKLFTIKGQLILSSGSAFVPCMYVSSFLESSTLLTKYIYGSTTNFTNMYASTGLVDILSTTYFNVSNITALHANISNIYTSTGFVDKLSTNYFNVSTMYALNANHSNMYTRTGVIDILSSSSFAVSTLQGLNGNFSNMYASTGNISTLFSQSTNIETICFNIPKPFNMFTNYVPKVLFEYDGQDQEFVVPPGVERIFVRLWGASGAGRTNIGSGVGGAGGNGAYVSGYLNVTPGDRLTVIVGGQGLLNTGGYGGGGSLVNIQPDSQGYGGGGRSALQLNQVDIVTAGGGGGADIGNIYGWGGDGGVYEGRSGVLYSGYSATGGGGTQTIGGAGGVGTPDGLITFNGTVGVRYRGGNGVSTATTFFGGGGGGGYYGGGGGGGYNYYYPGEPINGGTGGGGGGGSSYIDNLINANCIDGYQFWSINRFAADSEYLAAYGNYGDGLVEISYPTNLKFQYTDPQTKILVIESDHIEAGWIAGGGDATSNPLYSLVWSTDGSNWNPIVSGGFTDGYSANYANDVIYNGTMWGAVGNTPFGDRTSSIQISMSGIHWNSIQTGGFDQGNSITYSLSSINNGLWVAVGSNDETESTNAHFDSPTIQISSDGSNWNTISTTQFYKSGNGVAASLNYTFVAVGSNNVRRIGYGITSHGDGGIYIGVGESSYDTGNILYSYNDASIWDNITTGRFNGNIGYGISWCATQGGTNNIYVAVGDGKYDSTNSILYSQDGLIWNNSVSGGFVYNIGYGVACKSNGAIKSIAVGSGSESTNSILYSTDYINWKNINSGGFGGTNGYGIANQADIWVAVGNGGTNSTNSIIFSLNGSNWSNSYRSGFTNYIGYGVANNGANEWVAVGDGGTSTNSILYLASGSIGAPSTPNNLAWSNTRTGGFGGGIGRGVAYNPTNHLWVAVGDGGSTTSSILYSGDGSNWSNANNSFYNNIGYGITFNSTDNKWVAVGDGGSTTSSILLSTDGSNWNSATTYGFNANISTIKYSSDGINWSNAGTFDLQGNAVATNNSMWVAVGQDTTSSIKYSMNGLNWSNANTGFYSVGYGIAYGNGLWIALGDTAYPGGNNLETIQWSTDGSNWNNITAGGFRYSGYSAAFNGKYWEAVGFSDNALNNIQYSTDGSNWFGSENFGLNSSYCIAPGPVLQEESGKSTAFTKDTVQTTSVYASNVSTGFLEVNNITMITANISNAFVASAHVSTLTALTANIGDIYPYSYVKKIINANGFLFAIGPSATKDTSIQWSVDGKIWYTINSGGFDPITTYSDNRILSMTLPKGIIYNPDLQLSFAYGLTANLVNSNIYDGVLQHSGNITDWENYPDPDILTPYSGEVNIPSYVLSNLNSVIYVASNEDTPGRYLLLTSYQDPVWTSSEPGVFNNLSTLNQLSTATANNTGYGWNGPPLQAAYSGCKSTSNNNVYIVGTASPGGCPIYRTNSDGVTFFSTTTQVLPQTIYSMDIDYTNNILFVAGPGVQQNQSTFSTVMYSQDNGKIWKDIGYIPYITSVKSISYGYDSVSGGSNEIEFLSTIVESTTIITSTMKYYISDTVSANQLVITGTASNSSNTIATCLYSSQINNNYTNSFTTNSWFVSYNNGFTSPVDITGNTTVRTHTGTTTFFDPNSVSFLVGGLSDKPLGNIKNNKAYGGNIWADSIALKFGGTSEYQFLNSVNRSIIASNINTDTINGNSISTATSYTASASVSTLVVTKIEVSNIVAENATITNLYGNGSNLTGVTAAYLSTGQGDGSLHNYTLQSSIMTAYKFVGDGSSLTNLPSQTSGSFTAGDLTASNVTSGGYVVATGNITGANINTAGTLSANGIILGINGITSAVGGANFGGNIRTLGVDCTSYLNTPLATIQDVTIKTATVETNLTVTGTTNVDNITANSINATTANVANHSVSRILSAANITTPNLVATGGTFAGNGSGLTNIGLARSAQTTDPAYRFFVWGQPPQSTPGIPGGIDVVQGGTLEFYDANSSAQYGIKMHAGNSSGPTTIDVRGNITAFNVGVPSDIRIKKNIQQSANTLDIVNSIRVVEYDYMDSTHAPHVSHGVIAQELQKVYPEAITTKTEYIPSVFSKAVNVSDTTTTVTLQVPNEHFLQQGDMIKVTTKQGEDKKDRSMTVVFVDSPTSFTVSKWESYTQEEEVFVFGKQVNDFLTVDKMQLGVLALGASQTLSKQVKELQEENATLKALLQEHTEQLKTLMDMVSTGAK